MSISDNENLKPLEQVHAKLDALDETVPEKEIMDLFRETCLEIRDYYDSKRLRKLAFETVGMMFEISHIPHSDSFNNECAALFAKTARRLDKKGEDDFSTLLEQRARQMGHTIS